MSTPKLDIYPKDLPLRAGKYVTIRPLQSQDEEALAAFFQRLPEEDRFFLKDDVVMPGVVASWIKNLDYERVLPLVAFEGERIVGDATLHRRRGGARRHLGEVRVTVDPALRGYGLGTTLLQEVIDCAYQVKLETLVFELVNEEQAEAIDAARRAGFVESARLVNHIKDRRGKPQDLLIMCMPLGRWHAWW